MKLGILFVFLFFLVFGCLNFHHNTEGTVTQEINQTLNNSQSQILNQTNEESTVNETNQSNDEQINQEVNKEPTFYLKIGGLNDLYTKTGVVSFFVISENSLCDVYIEGKKFKSLAPFTIRQTQNIHINLDDKYKNKKVLINVICKDDIGEKNESFYIHYDTRVPFFPDSQITINNDNGNTVICWPEARDMSPIIYEVYLNYVPVSGDRHVETIHTNNTCYTINTSVSEISVKIWAVDLANNKLNMPIVKRQD